jgi:UDP-glucose 4-epimerase
MGRAEFVRADIRNPLIAKVISHADVDTVVHASVSANPGSSGGRTAMKEMNVIGTMQLLAACQKAPSVRRVVLKSTTAVYGSSPRDPALFDESMTPKDLSSGGYAKDAAEIEGYLRGFARRRPDVSVTVLRFTNFIGPRIDTVFTRYFALPVVPTVLGYDARVQMLHEEDALAVLERAASHDVPGVFNVAADGVLLLSQAIRRAGRIPLPVPSPAVGPVGRFFRGARIVDFSPEQMRLLNFGRVVDTARLRHQFGFTPRWTTMQAFDDFVRGRALRPVLGPDQVETVERGVRALAGVLR